MPVETFDERVRGSDVGGLAAASCCSARAWPCAGALGTAHGRHHGIWVRRAHQQYRRRARAGFDSPGAGDGRRCLRPGALLLRPDWAIDDSGGAERKSIEGGKGGDRARVVLLGTLLDGVPESPILGMGLSTGGAISVAFLTAVFVSNVPEERRHALSRGRGPHSEHVVACGRRSSLRRCSRRPWSRHCRRSRRRRTDTPGLRRASRSEMLSDVMMPEAFETPASSSDCWPRWAF